MANAANPNVYRGGPSEKLMLDGQVQASKYINSIRHNRALS